MLKKIKNHPFAVEAFFESSIVFTFAVPKEQLESTSTIKSIEIQNKRLLG